MNNQITLLDRNNQSINVNLICYFNNNNKKYVFYDKNETVQDGLIKMYVSEENTGLINDITQDEWNNLKKIMQGIITNNINNIEFLNYSSPIKVNEPKVIALNSSNVDSIKSFYKNAVGSFVISEPILNKDILSQNFGNNAEVSVSQTEPVHISSIPEVQNNFNMESTPVNLNMNSTIVDEPKIIEEPEIPSMESVVPNIEPIINVTSPLEPENNEFGALNINSIKPSGIDSGFKVSNEPNIFDNPMSYQITEEVNEPIVIENNESQNSVVDNDIKTVNLTEINDKKIELNKRKIKLFEELANIYKEENELLLNGSNDNLLERTASNLFNNNGTLNDNEVLN